MRDPAFCIHEAYSSGWLEGWRNGWRTAHPSFLAFFMQRVKSEGSGFKTEAAAELGNGESISGRGDGRGGAARRREAGACCCLLHRTAEQKDWDAEPAKRMQI